MQSREFLLLLISDVQHMMYTHGTGSHVCINMRAYIAPENWLCLYIQYLYINHLLMDDLYQCVLSQINLCHTVAMPACRYLHFKIKLLNMLKNEGCVVGA